MDNVLKKTIRQEIENYNREKVNSGGETPSISNPSGNSREKTKAPQTERRLTSLLNKIRSKNSDNNKGKAIVKKPKKLQVKYERFDPSSNSYKLVR